MSDTGDVESALERFESAIQQLESAMQKLQEQSAKVAAASTEAEALRENQVRLTREIEEVRARSRTLADQNRLAVKRIDQAMARIRRVLGE